MFETPYTPRFSIDNKSVKSHRRLSFLSMAPQQSNDSDKQRPATAKNRASISTSRFSFFRSDPTKTPTKKEKKERSLTSKIPQPAGLKAYRYTELPESDAPRSDDARSQSRESFNNIERPSPIVNKQGTPSSSSIPAPPLAAPSVAPAPLRISTQDRPTSPPTKKSPFDIPSPPPQSSPTSRPKSAASLTNARRRVSGILPPGFSSQKTYYRNSAPPESTVPLEGAPRLARSASCPRLAEQAASDLPTGNLKANYFMAHRPPSDWHAISYFQHEQLLEQFKLLFATFLSANANNASVIV